VESASSNLFFYPQAGLGATSNDQRITSLCYATRNDGHVLDIWVSAAKQGVAYYTYNGESQSSSVETISAGAMLIGYNGREVSVAGADAARISVYSTSGAMVADVRGENTLNVSLLARGMYIVCALDREGNVATRKILR
ncbi:MAG: T9SS type A sorting domain-containing protein, partial [Bacteroidales bacterium]|nr:T9SS type A sorting domain-containing protein [Bacteroidales bacterium]